MNIAPSSGQCTAPDSTTLKATLKKRADDLKALDKALGSGDLEAAKSAFEAFKADKAPARKAEAPKEGVAKDLDAIKTALEKGDVSEAQTAFASFIQNLLNARAAHSKDGHRHPRPENEAETQPTEPSATSGTLLNTTA